MQPLQSVITDFIEHCEIERGLSPNTAEKYHYRLMKFLDWAYEHTGKKTLSLEDLDLDLIRKFRVSLNREELNKSTQYNYMVTMRAFLKYLSKTDQESVKPEKIELGKYEGSKNLKFLKPDELDQLLAQPDTKTMIGMRDKAILELFFSTGLRVSELASLDRHQVDLKAREFTVIGKGNRRRVVFVSHTAFDAVSDYLEKREDEYIPLFLSYSGPQREVEGVTAGNKGVRAHKGSKSDEGDPGGIQSHVDMDKEDPDGERYRLSVRSIQRMVKKYTKKAGIAVDVTPHVLRHSFATDLLMAGADLRTVQESLGHKNVSTTQIYTHITNLQLKKAHEQFHGQWRE